MYRFFHRTPRQTYTEMDPSRKIVDFYRKIFTKDIDNAPMATAILEYDPNIKETLKVLQDDPSFDFKEEYKKE